MAGPVNINELAAFQRQAAEYFQDRDTGGEDRAHWANVFNAESCRKTAETLETLAGENQRLKMEIAAVQIRHDRSDDETTDAYRAMCARAEAAEARVRDLEQNYSVNPAEVNYAAIRLALAELSGIPAMAVVTMEHIAAIAGKLKAAEAKCRELEAEVIHQIHFGDEVANGVASQRDAAIAERDTLRRLLTETAVPALEKVELHHGQNCVDYGIDVGCAAHFALKTIRETLGDGNG